VFDRGNLLRWTIVGGVFLFGVAAAFVWWAVRPAPPSKIVLTAGASGGAYLEFAQRYAEILARDGVRVEVRTSPGSLENLRRLHLPEDDPEAADLAFVQSGVAPEEQRKGLIGLGHLYFEPAWLFVRKELGDASLADLGDRRLNIGPPGSGTHALGLNVLRVAQIDGPQAQRLTLGLAEAAAELRAGRIDAALMVAKADAPLVDELLRAPELTAVSWKRAEALQRRLPGVRKITVPAGVVDYKANIPDRDLDTIASLATLVAREDLHPALAFLLVRAAREIHGGPGLLHAARDFPSIRNLSEFEVPEDVVRLYEQGPPFLYRYLPYWLANLLMRLWVLVIPLAAVMAALSDWLPKLLTLGPSMRVQKLYRRVKALEAQAAAPGAAAAAPELLAEIDRLSADIDAERIPASMLDPHYGLRGKLRLLRADLHAARARLQGGVLPPVAALLDERD